MTSSASWRNLELRVADYFERNGYSARTSQKERGRSGLVHELDVLAERSDAAGIHRVVVECKAWRSPVEKDVVYKLKEVMRDTGLSKGIVVSVGGLRSGARVAAEQAHIDVWGPDEIRHYLGEEALAGLPIALPDEALGVAVEIDRDTAERDIRKARAGFVGLGAEQVDSVDVLWVPALELQLAVTRLRTGLITDREEVVRRWVLFESLAGRMIGMRDEPRTFVPVRLDAATVRSLKAPPQIVSELRRTVTKHRGAKSETAQHARQVAFNAIGLPGSTREFAVEAERAVFVPFYVGVLRRKGRERLIAVHAGVGSRSEEVERSLHEKINVVRHALAREASPSLDASVADPLKVTEPASLPVVAPREGEIPAVPACKCGEAMIARQRRTDGAEFWGCPTFPRCRHTRPIA